MLRNAPVIVSWGALPKCSLETLSKTFIKKSSGKYLISWNSVGSAMKFLEDVNLIIYLELA